MGKILVSELDSFVKFVDSEGGGDTRSPKVEARYQPFDLQFETEVDQSHDPFGLTYFQAQLDLYQEVANRKLDQWSGELHPVDISTLLDTANPQGLTDVTHVAENVRALSSMLSIAGLRTAARVLDMGAGHGMSSEVYAFCGAHVHAVDIDPQLSELATQRARRRSLDITRSVLNFDAIAGLANAAYDAAFFFQSLHHALRPWELIAELKKKLNGRGVIGFCGEPIQSHPWSQWGLRLDIESVYVARKFGWFESGWSRSFISRCFSRNGLKLALFDGGHEGNLIGIAAAEDARLTEATARAARLGFRRIEDEDIPGQSDFHSETGTLFQKNILEQSLHSRPNHAAGYLCFGPYIPLPAGTYKVSFLLTLLNSGSQRIQAPAVFDIVSARALVTHYSENILVAEGEQRLMNCTFTLATDTELVEARIFDPTPDSIWDLSLPKFARIAALARDERAA